MKGFTSFMNKMLDGMFGPREEYTFYAAPQKLEGVDFDGETELTFDDIDRFDFNQVRFLWEMPHFCSRHRFTLDSVHMNANDPGQDDMYFSCKNEVLVPVHNTEEPKWDKHQCSASRIIERRVFWNGPVKVQELYVDPEWLENYENNMYNRNMRAFERAMAFPSMIHIPEDL